MNQTMKDKIGAWLLDKNHTTQDLASQLDMSPQTLGNRLDGTFDWSWAEIVKLSKVLGCTPNELM